MMDRKEAAFICAYLYEFTYTIECKDTREVVRDLIAVLHEFLYCKGDFYSSTGNTRLAIRKLARFYSMYVKDSRSSQFLSEFTYRKNVFTD